MTWDSALAGGVVALGGKILWDWLSQGRRKNGGGSGEQPVTYWLAHFQDIKNILKERDSLFVDIEAKLDSLKESSERIEDMLRLRRR